MGSAAAGGARHFADQTARFGRKRWITFPFTAAAIARDPELRLTRLAE